jgi:hypothetical protein
MPRIRYIERMFSPGSLSVIAQADEICRDYAAQGYDLTLRQLYYQFVARDLIPNSQKEYKRLGSIINDARLAGLLDWDHLVDRTRNLRELAHWGAPQEIVDAVAEQFRTDRWAKQEVQPEVWVEKDALTGVIGRTAERLDVPWFSCRGYTSQSELWGAAQRHIGYAARGQRSVIIHLGDHDPSGVDMTRDIRDRMELFRAYGVTVKRIALNMDQVRRYNPPPNPVKFTDSRAEGYSTEHGESSWELDALDPATLDALITDAVLALRDVQWREDTEVMERDREILTQISERWNDVAAFLAEGDDR